MYCTEGHPPCCTKIHAACPRFSAQQPIPPPQQPISYTPFFINNFYSFFIFS